ncbi:hypothetical protein JAAARDRAFT_43960 [Jaapia argillacea MUCL 33604]|uniref:Uncharacterized protein n=1 Tax=Jaapia argillacea MUCL 33604 TaxID=933084 RepID=A0A067Q9L2_9AGAM|nr:hypothetical protein JAAARDRAFT_43960 [Jaapia argillacea MUCL 33604]
MSDEFEHFERYFGGVVGSEFGDERSTPDGFQHFVGFIFSPAKVILKEVNAGLVLAFRSTPREFQYVVGSISSAAKAILNEVNANLMLAFRSTPREFQYVVGSISSAAKVILNEVNANLSMLKSIDESCTIPAILNGTPTSASIRINDALCEGHILGSKIYRERGEYTVESMTPDEFQHLVGVISSVTKVILNEANALNNSDIVLLPCRLLAWFVWTPVRLAKWTLSLLGFGHRGVREEDIFQEGHPSPAINPSLRGIFMDMADWMALGGRADCGQPLSWVAIGGDEDGVFGLRPSLEQGKSA